MATSKKIYYGKEAVKKVEEKEGRKLSYAERRVVEEEGYVPEKYKDTKGIVTFGVGQTGKYMDMSFDETFQAHVKEAKRLVPNLDQLPEEVQAELIQATYRGDVGGSPTFRKLLNAGNYEQAAKEFLDNDDYREAVKDKTGVAGRMQKVADAIASLSKPAPVEQAPSVEAVAPPPFGIDPSDTSAIKSIQQISGLSGKDVDGVWGPQSAKAYAQHARGDYAQIDPRRVDTPKPAPEPETYTPMRNYAAEDLVYNSPRMIQPIRPLERTYEYNTMEDLLTDKGLMNPLLK